MGITGTTQLRAHAGGAIPDGGLNRCRICVMPLALDGDGALGQDTCRVCRPPEDTARPAPSNGSAPEKLDAEMVRIRGLGLGRPYDAVVGLSGGRDSSYLAYLLVRQHGLRCLAAYYRTPFTRDITDANVRRIARTLDIPLVEMPVSQDLHIRAARSYFLRWCKDPRPEFAALCCAGCKLVNREVFRIAQEHRTRSIVFAGNTFEHVPFLPTSRETDATPEGLGFAAQFGKTVMIFGKGLGMLRRCPPDLLPLSAKASLLYLNPHAVYLRLRYPGIYSMDYFFFAPWTESQCVETIQTHLGWQPLPGAVDTWKADCDFAAVKNYMFYRMNRVTYTDALYSNLIRAGQITRAEAMSRIQAGAGLSMECIERSMQVMGLSMDLIDRQAIAAAQQG